MKKLIFIFALLAFLPLNVHAENIFNETDAFTVAKAVKLGRGTNGNTYSSGTLDRSGSGAELLKSCDKNCRSCNEETGTCSVCKSGYYLKNNACSACPANAACSNGIAFICNDRYYKSADKCASICTNVSCTAGTTPQAQANSCCCY